MKKLIIENGPPLSGFVRVSGSKNAALPIMAASLAASGQIKIQNVPQLSDIFVMQSILDNLGADTSYNKIAEEMDILPNSALVTGSPKMELANRIRASFLVAGPLLSRFGQFKTALPGGCAIGTRPVDLHLKGFAALGADITLNQGYVEARADGLRGAEIYLDYPSVGATENLIMAAVLAEGITALGNCAMEPEVTDLCRFLITLGADISGIGTDTIIINGVKELVGGTYRIIPDRIEAGTFMTAACMKPGSDVTITNTENTHLRPVIAKLREMGANIIEPTPDSLRVYTTGRLNAVDVKTLPYPGFPTDMQAQLMALLAASTGRGVMTETVFENRYMHAAEMTRMGAQIKIDSRTAIIDGVTPLSGASVKATDLRAGAALVIAALGAKGTTEIIDIHHLERGYSGLDEKLRELGARVTTSVQ
ncbi:MAG: UDP-N-acetylglucosamine 1-carboxyvinyltransferase [Defluviitaleaceae bacterium]|nr:UDP-N-acetylglucosamine 1-carboxyvinyltransferase [Defluviitaleaceae bacterium]